VTQKLPSVANAVTAAVRAGKIEDQDKGARNLAERYATLIDRAEAVWQELEDLRGDPDQDDETIYKKIARLQAAVAAQQVASDLGPKLLQALDRLGLTPMARTGPTKGTQSNAKDDVPTGDSPADKLAQLRARKKAEQVRRTS